MNRDPDGGPRTLTRRAALRTAAGTVAAGVAGTAAAQGGVDYGDWFGNATGGETGNFDGTVDRTGQDSVTVDVGARATAARTRSGLPPFGSIPARRSRSSGSPTPTTS